MNAAIESVARLGAENVDEDENDMPSRVHNERMESQAVGFLIRLTWGVRVHGDCALPLSHLWLTLGALRRAPRCPPNRAIS